MEFLHFNSYLYLLHGELEFVGTLILEVRDLDDLTSKQTELFPGAGLHLSFGSLSTPVSRKAKLQDAGSLLILSEPTPSFVVHIRSRHSKFSCIHI